MYSLDWVSMFDGEIVYIIRHPDGWEFERHRDYHPAVHRLETLNQINNVIKRVSFWQRFGIGKEGLNKWLKSCASLLF